ncbi:unnamed protein product [Parnassius apollo]|uniref:(apollo) hypothetical protein n=1 Tax=Parnassius apollo TaxID=110799 RepID=A0A8S3YBJ0_PARAO|nr:unnamed protein product [Parnassius apollo]
MDDIQQLSRSRAAHKATYDKFDSIQTELESLSEDTDSQILERAKFKEPYFESLARAKGLVKAFSNEHITPEAKPSHSECIDSIKFPEIALPSFSGDFREPYRPDRPDRPERLDRPDRSKRPDCADGPDRPDRPERPDRPDRSDELEKPDRLDRPDRMDRPDRPDKPDRPDMLDRSDRPGRPDRPDRPERTVRLDRPDRTD